MVKSNDIISKLHERIGNPVLASLFMYLIYIADENGVVTLSYAEIGKAFKMSKQLVAYNINLLRSFDGILTDSHPITILNIGYYRGFQHTSFTAVLRKLDDKPPTKKQKKETINVDDFLTDSPKMNEVIKTWIAYKKEKKQSYKPIGLRTLVRKLVRLSDNDPDVARQIVEQSIMNNYSGLFELKKEYSSYRQDEQAKVANVLKDYL